MLTQINSMANNILKIWKNNVGIGIKLAKNGKN
jgi:hypothetical protein